MIDFSQIHPGEHIKVLVNVEDDIEDELYAKVKENCKDYLVVNYYNETSKIYKDAYLYDLEDKEELVQEINISEHYQDNNIKFRNVNSSLYALLDDIDSDCECSSIYDESDDDGSDLEDFIVSDTEHTGGISIPNQQQKNIDKEWNDWIPTSPGSRKYKEVVDSIETRVKYLNDEINF